MSQSGFTKRVAVTGGAGFIGSNLLRALVPKHPDILFVNVDCLTYAGDPENLAAIGDLPNYAFERIDIADESMLRDCWNRYQFTDVIHLAAETHVDRSIHRPASFVRTNVVGTSNLLACVRSQSDFRGRFLHISTDEVYGPVAPGERSREGDPFRPSSPYAASKAAAEHFVQAYHVSYGLATVITRCCNNYGPYQFPEKLIPLMIANGLQKRELPVYGDGLQVRDWLHVSDHCEAIELAWLRGRSGAAYNIGGAIEIANIDLVRQLCDIMDTAQRGGEPHASLIRHVADRPGHDRRYALDCTLIERELGWRSRTSLAEGLASTVQWYCGQTSWLKRKIGRDG